MNITQGEQQDETPMMGDEATTKSVHGTFSERTGEAII